MILTSAIQAALTLGTRGIPAIRSGVFGARLGAGAAFARSTVERLGIRVGAGEAAALATTGAAIERGGVALSVSKTGAVAVSVSEGVVSAAARASVRTALAQVGRATAMGALGGAAVDAVIAGVEVVPALRAGTMDRADAAKAVGKRALRGAAAGAAGVAAAGAASAVVAATGITLAGAPVVVPLVAMVAAGAWVGKVVEKRLGVGDGTKLVRGEMKSGSAG